MLRTSSYTIYINLSDGTDDVLLVHGYTGAFDRVSKSIGDFLRAHETGRPARPLYGEWSTETGPVEAAEDLGEEILSVLVKQGYLTEKSLAEEEEHFSRLAGELQSAALKNPPTYVFMPTYDCNLRCRYCFQDHMRTDSSFHHLLQRMSVEMVDRIFSAMQAIEEQHGIVPGTPLSRDIGLFGGEPLLAANRPTVERIVNRARDFGSRKVWAVTNATELDAYEDLLGSDGLSFLQVTLDGTREQHDRRRIGADGSGTYDRIARHIDLALDRGTRVSVRLNVDRHNLAELPGVAGEIVARGWHRRPGFGAYAAPIQAQNPKTDRKETLSSWELTGALTRMRQENPALHVLGRPDETLRARVRRIFESDTPVSPSLRPSFCGAHDRMYLFDPFGEIYTCWEKTGDSRISVGKITPEGKVSFRFDQLAVWRGRTVASNPVCRRCRYAFHCGGGCAILALAQNGDLYSNYCDNFANRFKKSVAEAYGEYQAAAPSDPAAERVCDL